MDEKKRTLISDSLEILIVISVILLIITIYVPVAIWEEEDSFREEAQFRMQTIFDVESFYKQISGQYNEDPLWALNVVNAVRDSLTADSTYLGEQVLKLHEKSLTLDIPNGYDVEFDTTFGFLMSRRDTIMDTSVTVVMFIEDLSRNDTIFVQKKQVNVLVQDPGFREVLDETPVERVELIQYYDSFMPDSSMFFCPLTKTPYDVNLSENNSLRVASPIQDMYKERRYLVFSFKANNHGYINDGSRSWD